MGNTCKQQLKDAAKPATPSKNVFERLNKLAASNDKKKKKRESKWGTVTWGEEGKEARREEQRKRSYRIEGKRPNERQKEDEGEVKKK